MTITFLLYEYARRVRGGMGGFRHARELAEAWQRLGHAVVLVRPRVGVPPEPAAVRVLEVTAPDVPGVRPLVAYARLVLAALARAPRPDVVYAREMAGPAPLLVARLRGCPLVLEVNGDSYRHRAEALRASRSHLAALRALQAVSFRGSDRIVTVTEGLREALLERFGLPPAKVVTVENGANIERMRPLDTEACRRQLGLAGTAVVGFVGTCFAHQGVQTLIAAAPAILAARPGTHFLIVGDGEMRAAWEAEVARRGLGTTFTFTGQVPFEHVAAHINAMDLTVAPFTAQRGETSPLKIFDSLACGRPVVVSAIPAVRGLVSRSGGCVAVAPDEPDALAAAVTGLLADDARRRRLGEDGRAFVVRDHGWDAVARRVLGVCEDARAAHRDGQPARR